MLYLVLISSNLIMNLAVDIFHMGGNFLMMNFDFVFVRYVSLNSDINLKLK